MPLQFGGQATLGEKTLCPEDGFVLIRKSELLCGFLDKSIIGESKSSFFYALLCYYGATKAAEVCEREQEMTKLRVFGGGMPGRKEGEARDTSSCLRACQPGFSLQAWPIALLVSHPVPIISPWLVWP